MVRCFEGYPTDTYSLLEQSTLAGGERVALIFKGQRWSYRELKEQADRLASGLAKAGIAAGDRVILFMGNRPEFIAAFFALQRLGAIPTPIGIREQRDGLTWMANQCGAAAIIFESRYAERLPEPKDAPAIRLSINVDTEQFATLLTSEIGRSRNQHSGRRWWRDAP